MEDIAQQLDSVRNEMVSLLYDYTIAGETERARIYERCEMLGGEIQELVGLLKLCIRNADREAAEKAHVDPEYAEEVMGMCRESLTAVHAASEEVSSAVRLLRDSRPPDEFPGDGELV